MRTATLTKVVSSAFAFMLVGLVGCEGEYDGTAPNDAPVVFLTPSAWSAWSDPVPVEELNTTANDGNANLSNDGLTLYLNSNRSGGLGGNDIYVSRRASTDDPWGTPESLGSVVNSSSDDQGPSISKDGLLLFFLSTRPGGLGAADLYVSRRTDPTDETGWGTPENLGSDVNTSGIENAPHFQKKGEDGNPSLYFARAATNDIYVAPMTKDGATLGPAVALDVLNSSALDGGPCVSKDGLELIFNSNRAGGFGAFDLYVSTRADVHDAWSPPQHLGAPPNSTVSTVGDFSPALSSDGRTLMFTRADGSGNFDIWMSTRTVIGNGGGD